jgi:uncharacterized protein with PIN domain
VNRIERCPKCDAMLEEGFLLDSTHNAVRVGRWADGPPTYWFLRILRMKGRRRLAIEAGRCPKCGLLQLWAPKARD